MRVILALAERYQPRSVKQRVSGDTRQHPKDKDRDRDKEGIGDHMTYTLHTDSNVLKRSQSPEGALKGMNFSLLPNNSCSVPNMVSMNVHAGGGGGGGGGSGKVGVARSGSGYRYVVLYLLSTVSSFVLVILIIQSSKLTSKSDF